MWEMLGMGGNGHPGGQPGGAAAGKKGTGSASPVPHAEGAPGAQRRPQASPAVVGQATKGPGNAAATSSSSSLERSRPEAGNPFLDGEEDKAAQRGPKSGLAGSASSQQGQRRGAAGPTPQQQHQRTTSGGGGATASSSGAPSKVATVLLPPGTLTNNGHGHGHGHASSQPAAATSAPGAQAKGAADSSAGGGGATGGGGGWLSNAASGGIGSGGGASGAPSDVQLVGWLESRLRDYEDLQLRHWALEAEHRELQQKLKEEQGKSAQLARDVSEMGEKMTMILENVTNMNKTQ